MKKIVFIGLSILFSINSLTSQSEVLVPLLNTSTSNLMNINGYIYISINGYIQRYDIAQEELEETLYLSQVYAISTAVYNNDLYVSLGPSDWGILKTDFLSPSNDDEFMNITTDANGVLLVQDNFLYYTSSFDDSIHRYNLNNPMPTSELVASGIEACFGIAYKDGFLYAAEWKESGKLYRLV